MITDPFTGLAEAVAALRDEWVKGSGVGVSGGAGSLSDAALIAVNGSLGAMQRHLDAVRAPVAAEIAHRSRPELGAESLAKQQGYRNPVTLIATTTGTTNGDAARLVAVGAATAPRMTFSGVALPAKHPHVAEAMDRARLSERAAGRIIAMLDRVALRAAPDAIDRAEKTLTAAAPGLGLEQLDKLIARAEAYLDADGLEPKEQDRRSRRQLRMFERDGMLHLDGCTDIADGAPLKAAIDALVSAQFRAANESPRRADGHNEIDTDEIDTDRRTLPQRRIDALVTLAQHAVGCEETDLPLDGATVIVRVTLDDLEGGSGHGTIDGIDQPVSISAVRRMAAGGGVIPCVLGTRSEILDWGRGKRLFTKAQKLALVERDGGCAMCGLPPGMTRAHHLDWWKRDHGRTDLSKGVLLCESCHHRIHENGWEIRTDSTGVTARVWFIPPPHVDPHRTPRLGGRARYDYAA